MPEPPDLKDVKTGATEEYTYNFDQAEQILEAMDFLREEAVKTRIPEVIAMVDASFRLLVTSYHCILRYEMTKLPGTDDLQ
jgi:hypothetical protein